MHIALYTTQIPACYFRQHEITAILDLSPERAARLNCKAGTLRRKGVGRRHRSQGPAFANLFVRAITERDADLPREVNGTEKAYWRRFL
jgi:hypothetical protein